MGFFSVLSSEFAKLAASKGVLASVVAALLVPVVYGGILLSATWGPYDHLNNLPVAVVNNDRGAMSDGSPVNVGEELVNNLREGEDLGWEFVDSTDAMKGLQDDKYYMAIVIPEGFSERVTTVMDPNPQKLELEYIQNEGLNFLAAQVTRTATEKIREKLADTITQTYVTKVFSSLGDISEGFAAASDGSSQLADGTVQLHDGTNELYESVSGKTKDIARLADGANQLKAGTGQLYNSLASKQSDITKLANGTKELKDGTSLLLSKLKSSSGDINKLANGSKELYAGTVDLKDGTGQILAGLQKAEPGSKQLRDGLGQLAPGSKQVTDGAARLAAGAKALEEGIKQYQNFNVTTKVDPNFQKIVEGSEAILAGANSLRDGAKKVSDGLAKAQPGSVSLNEGLKQLVEGQKKVDAGAAKLRDGAKQIADGNATVNKGWGDLTDGVTRLDNGAAQIYQGNQAVDQGWKKLTDGAGKIDNGMAQVNDGTTQVNQGWVTLADGATKLNDGAGKVNDGTQQLATGLKEGAAKTSGLNLGPKNIEMFSAPVELKSDTLNEYQYYRDSTAPYVITLGLFVGILIMSMFINFRRPAEISAVKWFTVKFINLSGLALLQAALLSFVVLVLLDLQVDSLLGFLLMAVVASLSFSAIVLFLAAFGGNIGRLIALAFVIIQLSTTGSNLPIEMLPDNLRNLSEYLPFTYSISGFKSVITLNNMTAAVTNMGILLGFMGIFALLSFVVFIFVKDGKHTHTEEKEEGYAF